MVADSISRLLAGRLYDQWLLYACATSSAIIFMCVPGFLLYTATSLTEVCRHPNSFGVGAWTVANPR
jgi:hypothetical protein